MTSSVVWFVRQQGLPQSPGSPRARSSFWMTFATNQAAQLRVGLTFTALSPHESSRWWSAYCYALLVVVVQ